MAKRIVKFDTSALNLNSKKKILKKDENGYYEHALGAFNVFNSEGKYYPMLDKIAKEFSPTGGFVRRVKNGQCFGELDHPPREENQSMMAWIKRLLKIVRTNVSHHIKSVELVETKDENGNKIVLVVGWIKPYGTHKALLEEALENPDENVSFSLRSLVDEFPVGATIEKRVRVMITYDWVHESGVKQSTTYTTPSLESYMENVEVTDAMLRAIAKSEATTQSGLEDSTNATRVLTELGWSKVQLFEPKEIIVPDYLKW